MIRAFFLVVVLASALAVGLGNDASAQSYSLPTPTPTPDTSTPLIPPLRLMTPFPVVRIVGLLTRRGARIRLLSVRAPISASIFVRCLRRGCRRRSVRQGRGFGRTVRFKRFERRLAAGTIIEVRVGRRDVIGKFTRFRVRRGRRPARADRCLRPGESRGTPCPEQ